MQFHPQLKEPQYEHMGNPSLVSVQPEKRSTSVNRSGLVRRMEDREPYQPMVDHELQSFRDMIFSHNWYYDYSKSLDVFNAGYNNEVAIVGIVNRKGGVYKTIWETEKNRNRPPRV